MISFDLGPNFKGVHKVAYRVYRGRWKKLQRCSLSTIYMVIVLAYSKEWIVNIFSLCFVIMIWNITSFSPYNVVVVNSDVAAYLLSLSQNTKALNQLAGMHVFLPDSTCRFMKHLELSYTFHLWMPFQLIMFNFRGVLQPPHEAMSCWFGRI